MRDANRLLGLLVLVALIGCSAVGAAPQEPADEAPESTESQPTGESEEQEYSNTLRWSTASEVENFGFDVYRGPTEEGPFERLTEDPIPGAGTVDTLSKYQYVDGTIDPTKAYWYYVESISIHGVREKFTPVFRAKPKLPQEEPSEEESEDGEPESDPDQG